ncbi:MAG: hypothetical protein NT069_08190 [Planctomycetota bacterium]|nr:hypothetical protein [Planctomycetota bacterium]
MVHHFLSHFPLSFQRMVAVGTTGCRWVCRLVLVGCFLWDGWSSPTAAYAQTKPKPKGDADSSTKSGAKAVDRKPRARAGKSDGRGGVRAGGQDANGMGLFTSNHFELHTDMTREEAVDLLERLEKMLGLISKYWGKPAVGVIDMYVVKDLSKWPAGSLNPEGLAHIEAGAGVTLGKTMTRGDEFISKATVYAVADRGTPQHEAVHAYCVHAFGRVGPVWYAEGMAEMGQYWRGDDRAVHAHRGVCEYLRRATPMSLNEIVNGTQKTGDSWQNYAWRWALCHLLANNPNYSPRFRPLGGSILSGQKTSFESVYGAMSEEIIFEYLLFLSHLEEGFRVDLCAWDWKSKFKALSDSATVKVRVDAGRGWQASKVIVSEGKSYDYETEGEWTLEKDGEAVSAKGGVGGRGRLEGVLLFQEDKGYRLGKPFPLGDTGTYVAAESGRLFLRCRDDWAKIDDNKGSVTVRLKLAEGKKGLPTESKTDSVVEADRSPPKPALER